MNTDEPLPTRASLLDRLKDAGDHASWEEFHRTYHGLHHSSEEKSDAVSINVGGVVRTATLAEISDPALNLDVIWDAEWQRHLLGQALARVKRQVKPEQYAIYHLHVIEERPVAEVRRTLGVNVAQVYLAKHRVGAALKKELQRLQKAEI